MAVLERGEGPAVVCLHAFGCDRRLWQPQIEGLSGHRRVIALDLRGFGGEPDTDGAAVSMDAYADDVIDQLDRLGVRTASFVGLSVGGYVALSIALRAADRVDALVLANTRASPDSEEARAGRLATANALRASGPRAIVDAYGDRLFGQLADADVRDRVRQMMLSQPASALVSATLGMADRPDRRPALSRIRVPVLVVSGSADVLIAPAMSRELLDGPPDAHWAEIAGAGHLSSIEAPQPFTALLDQFLPRAASR